ncbi:MAG: tRNA-dihydrouridine synthase [Candidatus Levybacteria bacterium]|nr:tRNA-dihydrouridine synthase [Candidatus Levybacteria bacterium]
MKFIWQKLKRPFFVLAPMEDVTDSVFRRIVGKYAPPDVYITEFTNTDALTSLGEKSALQRLLFTEKERPIIAQIWGIHPTKFYEAAQRIAAMGFDGIDINMGCPQREIIKDGACSALIANHELAKHIIDATKKGAPELPLSVKTRIGMQSIETEKWIGFLLEQQLDALIIHARTAKEMSDVPAHWNEVKKAVELRDAKGQQAVVIGNGDVIDREDGKKKARETGADGIMIGRGVFHNLFALGDNSSVWPTLAPEQKISILKEHVRLFDKTWGKHKKFAVLKKFFKIYVNGFPNASAMRMKFMETTTHEEAIVLANSILSK